MNPAWTFPQHRAPFARAPLARMGQAPVGAVYAGDCDQLIRVWFPDGVQNLKAHYDPYFEATDAAVKACPALPVLDRQSWDLFVGQWRILKQKDTTILSAGADAITVCGMVKSLDGWREKLAQVCHIPGGEVVEPKNTPADTLRVVGYTAMVVAGAFLIITFAPQIKALLPGKK
jgi:hypothetical protein